MKKMSEACWEAANLHLWDGDTSDGSIYSCLAVEAAGGDRTQYAKAVCVSEDFAADFGSIKPQDRQAARYMLLLFAMHYFEDLGQ